MRRSLSPFFSAFLVLLSAAIAFAAPQEDKPSASSQELAAILKSCAGYCEKLENSVLDFVCVETMHERVFRPHLRKVPFGPTRGGFLDNPLAYDYQLTRNEKTENEFVYDYQLVRKGGRVDESRTLVRENGQEKQEKDAQLKTAGFRFKNIIFGPIVLLGGEWQSRHNYEIIGNTTLESRKAVVIKATPKPGEWLGYLYGTVWVDRDNFGVLKIEWTQESLENYGRVWESARKMNLKPDIVLTGEYGYEKNGLRFPSKFIVRERYIYSGGMKFPLYELDVVYSAYKFFTVETEVKY
jgi:hypothetical protein